MEKGLPLILFCFLFLLHRAMATNNPVDKLNRSIGVIVDCSSRAGREESVAMAMAVDDFFNLTGHRLVLQVSDSQGDPIRAASAAMDLINEQKVQAIIGPSTWQEASFVVELAESAQLPILSFANYFPPRALERWPFLVRITRNQHLQMRAVAAIVRSWRWRRVTAIYEDLEYASTSIIPYLSDALRDAGSEIDHWLALPPFSTSYSEKLEMLRSRQCRVFIVHTSIESAIRLFAEAKQMGMMESDYVWITTDGITSLLDSANSSVIASMQGVLGIKNYFHPSVQLSDFYTKFRRSFLSKYPEAEMIQPQLLALQAYDAVWALAMATEKISSTAAIPVSNSKDGQLLLEAILQSNFSGLSGEFHFVDSEFSETSTFQILNVVGRSYREVGFWSYGSGFSESVDETEGYRAASSSMESLGQVYWPGGPWSVPKGWAPPTSDNPLKIAVPAKAVFPEFVNVRYNNQNETIVEGFCIDVFNATVNYLPYYLPYQFIPYNGTYDSLLEHDQMKTYDVLVGDTSISSDRYQYVEFSQPYTPSGLVMVVPVRSDETSNAWIFLKPFTASMWALTALVSIYNGLVVWLIERKCNSDFRGSFWNQIGTLFWLSFTTLLSPGEKLHSNLSRVAMVVWLFVAMVLTSNYTASLSSILTVRRLEPDLVSIESLKMDNVMVGCSSGSVVGKYLEEVLGFHPRNIRKFSLEEDYPQALRSGDIQAAFLRIPHANLLMAKYCKGFAITGPVYHVGGLGFVFPKGSPLLADISQALLKVFETGMIQKLEKAMLASYNCSSFGSNANKVDRLNLDSFWGLFAITVFTSTIALMIYGVCLHKDTWGWNEDSDETPASKTTGELVFYIGDHRGAKRITPLQAGDMPLK